VVGDRDCWQRHRSLSRRQARQEDLRREHRLHRHVPKARPRSRMPLSGAQQVSCARSSPPSSGLLNVRMLRILLIELYEPPLPPAYASGRGFSSNSRPPPFGLRRPGRRDRRLTSCHPGHIGDAFEHLAALGPRHRRRASLAPAHESTPKIVIIQRSSLRQQNRNLWSPFNGLPLESPPEIYTYARVIIDRKGVGNERECGGASAQDGSR
jgi:hypothetical protein